MANHKRTLWDELEALGRELLKRLEEMLNPGKKGKPARVPVPVRHRQPQDDPYGEN